MEKAYADPRDRQQWRPPSPDALSHYRGPSSQVVCEGSWEEVSRQVVTEDWEAPGEQRHVRAMDFQRPSRPSLLQSCRSSQVGVPESDGETPTGRSAAQGRAVQNDMAGWPQ